MIKAIAIDDEPLALNIVKAYCDKLDYIDLLGTFTETDEALAFLKDHPVDLLFLDIQMPSMSGIEFYKLVGTELMVIFTTAHSEYAVEGFNLSAIDYLLKPFYFERFQQATDKAREYVNYMAGKAGALDHFFVRADYSTIKVPFADIQYIEGLDNYLKIHLQGRAPIVARLSMRSILEKLPESMFARVHRSYIVPIQKVTAVRNKTIFMGELSIPVGTNYTDVLQRFKGGE